MTSGTCRTLGVRTVLGLLLGLIASCGDHVSPNARVAVVVVGPPGEAPQTSAVVRDALDHFITRQPTPNAVPAFRTVHEELAPLGLTPLESRYRWLQDNGVEVLVQAEKRDDQWSINATTWPTGEVLWSSPVDSADPRSIWENAPI